MDVDAPTYEILQQLQSQACNFFTANRADGFYFRYFPTLLPLKEAGNSGTIDDYQLTFQFPSLNVKAEGELFARALLYCPGSDAEIGDCQTWFSPQEEALRLTPLLHQSLKEHATLSAIQLHLTQPWEKFFIPFIQSYVLKDTHLDEHHEKRQLLHKGKLDWRALYPEIAEILPPKRSLFEAYKVARQKWSTTRNPKIWHVLQAFLIRVENLIRHAQLPEDMQIDLLHELKEIPAKAAKKSYVAKRPTFCISDIECSQILYLIIHLFCMLPKKHQIAGETALFIWIAQHASFSSVDVKEKEILNLSTNDIDFEGLVIRFGKQEAYMTDGLAMLLATWIGQDKNRRLFLRLNADNLEDTIGRISSQFLGAQWKLQPRDLLAKVHVIPGARIPITMRKQLDAQEALINSSVYQVNTSKIRKQILAAHVKNGP